jgi:hypothetical protein
MDFRLNGLNKKFRMIKKINQKLTETLFAAYKVPVILRPDYSREIPARQIRCWEKMKKKGEGVRTGRGRKK